MKKNLLFACLFLLMSTSMSASANSAELSAERAQERKCTYRVLFYLLKAGIKRGLNDLTFYLPEANPGFMEALVAQAPGTGLGPADIAQIENALAAEFDTMDALDAMCEDYRVWHKEVPCCVSNNC